MEQHSFYHHLWRTWCMKQFFSNLTLSDLSIFHRVFPTMSLHPLASRTPTAWPILKLLPMARIILSTLPDLGSGASPEDIQKNFFYTNLVYFSVPTILISPWVGKAVIEHEGTNNGHAYTHSSIAGFISKANPFLLLIILLILMDYYGSASSGISTMESPWRHVWLSRLPSSISLRTISVMTFQSPFPTLIQIKCELRFRY